MQGLLPDWVVVSFPILRIIFAVLMGLLALAVVVCIFLQPAAADGSGALTGQVSDSYYSKHKEKSFQGLVKKLTIAFAIAAAVIAVLFFITIRVYDPAPGWQAG